VIDCCDGMVVSWTVGTSPSAGLVSSMSRKGRTPDDSACEGFFGRLKNEMFYGRPWHDVSVDGFMDALEASIHWYNEARIKMSLGGMSPLEYRKKSGLAAQAGPGKRPHPRWSTSHRR